MNVAQRNTPAVSLPHRPDSLLKIERSSNFRMTGKGGLESTEEVHPPSSRQLMRKNTDVLTTVSDLGLSCTIGNYGVTQQKAACASPGERRWKGVSWCFWYRSKREGVCKCTVWMSVAASTASCFHCPELKQRW